MILKLGHMTEASQVPNAVGPRVKQYVYTALKLLDDEYGYTRNTDCDDGGCVILCLPGTDEQEIRRYFRYEQHVPEWCKRLSDAYCATLYITDNEYSVELILPVSDAPKQITDELAGE